MNDAASLVRLADARRWLQRSVAWPAVEHHPPAAAAGGIAAATVTAPADWPAAATARDDGVAVVAAETAAAGLYSPLRLAFADGRAAPVAAGERLPAPCDAVVPLGAAALEPGAVVLSAVVAAGEGVRRPGADVAGGEIVLEAGQRIGPLAAARLQALGITALACRALPPVTLVAAGQATPAVTTALLAAMLRRAGVRVRAASAPLDAGPDALEAATAGGGLLLVCGGSGEHPGDAVRGLLVREGELFAPGVAMQPGLGTRLGRLGDAPIVALPAQPWPALAAAWLLLRPAGFVEAAAGPARLAAKLTSSLGLTELLPLRRDADGLTPLPRDAALPAAALAAVAIVDEASEGHGSGETVTVDWLEESVHG